MGRCTTHGLQVSNLKINRRNNTMKQKFEKGNAIIFGTDATSGFFIKFFKGPHHNQIALVTDSYGEVYSIVATSIRFVL